MNKSKSKYFNTALKMDMALIELLEKKDFEYITIREICITANVNRSTFYLHYENTVDLLEECFENAISKLYKCYEKINTVENYDKCNIEELCFITPKYLTPYLQYIKENQKLFKTITKNQTLFNTRNEFHKLFKDIFNPILNRFNVPEKKQKYMVLFFLNGVYAIINEWIKNNFKESID
ncbi:MAG: TetR/AcrR family transcriptional regulator, partial [Ruminococcus sp.]|nr:TetR/AcrR family transcriptional regulator [Ruminococcus sp.]